MNRRQQRQGQHIEEPIDKYQGNIILSAIQSEVVKNQMLIEEIEKF